MEVITPNSPAIKKLKVEAKSGMFIRVGRADTVHFSRSASVNFGLNKFDRVQFVRDGKEVWIRKTSDDGFIVMVDGKGNARLCDTALAKWICQAFRRKPPFRLNVVVADGSLYIKAEAVQCQ